MRTHVTPHAARHPFRGPAAALALMLCLVAATPVAAVPSATGKNAAVIATWNQVAVSVIPPNPAAFLNYAFVHLAMYNAVNGITGRYDLYQWDQRANMSASPEAAAAAAAHRVLSTYFPVQAAALGIDAQLATSLAAIPSGERRDRGVAFGRLAADRIIELRTGDGRGAAVIVPPATEAGDWRPTPPAEAAFAVPWLGGVTPLAIGSLSQFDPGAPPPIGSDLYRTELAEVRAIGASDATGGARTLEQELTARYFADIPFGPMEAGLRDLATRYGLDISDSARLFAATNTAIADSIGTAWNAKLEYMWWRPITAIREIPLSDGDDLTVPVPGWTPLITTPPYPDWPSGLCSVIGAMTTSLEQLTGGVDITIVSPTQGARHWSSKAVLDQTAVDARVWSGIHFRTADAVSIDIGTDVTNLTLDRYFQPSH
jgi:hypothetical protein